MVGDSTVLFVVLHAAEGYGGSAANASAVASALAGTVARKSDRELLVIGGDPDLIVHVETRVRPGEHALSRLDVHQLALHEHLEHGASEGLCESSDVVERHMDENPIGAKTAVGYKEM